MKAWLAKANDPALKVCDCFWTGAPAGISESFGCLDGLFPKVDSKEDTLAPDELQTDTNTFANYDGVEDESDVANALQRYREAGYFKCCNSLSETETILGAKPILLKHGCVKKTRVNPATGASSTKKRLIVNSKQSRVTAASKRIHKSNLSTITNNVKGFLGLLKDPEHAPGTLEGADI